MVAPSHPLLYTLTVPWQDSCFYIQEERRCAISHNSIKKLSSTFWQHFFVLVMSKSLSTYTKSTDVSHEGCWCTCPSTIHPSEALSVMLHPCKINIARITNAALCKKCIKDAHAVKWHYQKKSKKNTLWFSVTKRK